MNVSLHQWARLEDISTGQHGIIYVFIYLHLEASPIVKLCDFCLGMQGMDDISAALENLTPLEKSIAL